VKITEALRIMQATAADAPAFRVTLACGFTPLHLHTFLNAHLQVALPGRAVGIKEGLYGDLAGTLERVGDSDGLAVVIEWPDLDARLDYRNSGAWGRDAMASVVEHASMALSRIKTALARVPAGIPIALALPSLPIVPIFSTPGCLASEAELLLNGTLLQFAGELAHDGRVRVVSRERLAQESPWETRFDLKSDLKAGLPYSLQHADAMAALLAKTLVPAAPKKGIISDLDDTMWKGIVGDEGPENVHWDLHGDGQMHALYQKLLGSLSDNGTLVGVASKNDPAVVAKTFERSDMILRSEQVFPIEASWNAKSGAVKSILEIWNIAADSVIFVDDSPMELAEVAAQHPGIECVLFPKQDPVACLQMLRRLRDLCGKDKVSADDLLRLASIRQGAAFRQQTEGGSAPETFLQQAKAVVTFDFSAAGEARTLELVNKTNQFNLNGRRWVEADWHKEAANDKALIVAVSYEDKFGPLGTIAVAKANFRGEGLLVDTWVMSCRAFSRRIEHQTLRLLFEATGAKEIEFAFEPTAKNGPTREFFASLLGQEPSAEFSLNKSQFDEVCPALYHEVRELKKAEAHG
jgi:FkbH-like protein